MCRCCNEKTGFQYVQNGVKNKMNKTCTSVFFSERTFYILLNTNFTERAHCRISDTFARVGSPSEKRLCNVFRGLRKRFLYIGRKSFAGFSLNVVKVPRYTVRNRAGTRNIVKNPISKGHMEKIDSSKCMTTERIALFRRVHYFFVYDFERSD